MFARSFEKISIMFLSAASALALNACSGQEFGVAAQNQSFGMQAIYNNQVDILWVVDDSGSMGPRQASLAAQAPSFLNALNGTGLDYHIAVTTMDMSGTGEDGRFIVNGGGPMVLTQSTPNLQSIFAARLQPGGNGSPLERGLLSMQTALSSPLIQNNNAGFLRTNAMLVVIFLSDEDDSSADSDYGAFLDQLRPPAPSGARSWVAQFIGVLPNDPACQTSAWNYSDPGTKYISLANESGGVSESICNSDYATAVAGIKERILEVITQYRLSGSPVVSSIVVTVNGQSVPNNSANGYTYDATTNSIVFHGSYVPTPTSNVNVTFNPAHL